MNTIKKETWTIFKFGVFGLLFLFYNAGVTRGNHMLSNVTSVLFLLGALLLVQLNTFKKKKTKEEFRLYIYYSGILLSFLARSIYMLIIGQKMSVCIFGPNSFIVLFLSFLVMLRLFINYTKKCINLSLFWMRLSFK